MLVIAKSCLPILIALKWSHSSSKSAAFQQLEADQIHLLSAAWSQNSEDKKKKISAGINSDLLIFYYPH